MGKTKIVRNAMSRPVEVHFAGRVAVMLPGDKLTLDETEVSDPGVRPLVRSGALSCFDAPAEPPPRPGRSRKPRAKSVRAAKPADAMEKAAPRARKKAADAPPERAPTAKRKAKAGKESGTHQARPAADSANHTETSR